MLSHELPVDYVQRLCNNHVDAVEGRYVIDLFVLQKQMVKSSCECFQCRQARTRVEKEIARELGRIAPINSEKMDHEQQWIERRDRVYRNKQDEEELS